MKAKVVFLIILFLLMLAVPAAVIVFSSPDGVSVYKNPSPSSAPPCRLFLWVRLVRRSSAAIRDLHAYIIR